MPADAMPAPIEIMFCSATPTLKKRPGWRCPKSMVRLAKARSALSTTIRSSSTARSASSSPATKAGTELAVMPLPEPASFRAKPGSVDRSWSSGSRRHRRTHGLQSCVQFGHDVVVVGADQLAHVPTGVELHALDAATLDRVGDDDVGHKSVVGLGAVERAEDGREVVAVDPLHVPPE